MSQSQRILIIGAGFGGLWSALSAVLALENAGKRNAAEIVLIAPEPALHIRPRFYETDLSNVTPSIKEVLDTVGVQYIQGIVTHIDTSAHSVTYNGDSSISYARLILATGSKVVMPTAVSGLEKHAFVVDDYKGALALDKHLKSLSSLPDSPARNTVVVAGGGFTGIEAATELPGRLAQLLGKGVAKVVLIERNKEVGPDLGPGPRPVILEALKDLGITSYTGEGVASIDADKVTTESGRCIETKTVIWTAGVRASSLTEQINGAERDANNRLVVDANLKVVGVADVYATGDTAHALTDGEGHAALMSCQHAVIMGRSSGYNAARDLLGLPPRAYSQLMYTTCLDLGGWGAVLTFGWDRKVAMQRETAKKVKQAINTKLIYPPPADKAAILTQANPTIGFEEKDGEFVAVYEEL